MLCLRPFAVALRVWKIQGITLSSPGLPSDPAPTTPLPPPRYLLLSNPKQHHCGTYIELNNCNFTLFFRLKPIIWNSIVDFNPDVFIWLGDNIYGDIRRPFRVFGKERTVGPWKNVPRFSPSSEDEMKSRYLMAKNNPGYSTLRRTAKVLGTSPQRDGSFHFFFYFFFLNLKYLLSDLCILPILPLPLILLWLPNHQLQVIGTWDDHDYGLNDAGKEFSAKVTYQRLLLDFLDEPQDSPRFGFPHSSLSATVTFIYLRTSHSCLTSCRMLPLLPNFLPLLILTHCDRRKQAGVYTSYTFGPMGRQVKVL